MLDNLGQQMHNSILFIQEFETNWEESRQGRVDSWMSFQKGVGGGKAKGQAQQR